MTVRKYPHEPIAWRHVTQGVTTICNYIDWANLLLCFLQTYSLICIMTSPVCSGFIHKITGPPKGALVFIVMIAFPFLVTAVTVSKGAYNELLVAISPDIYVPCP